jgi:ribosomal protein L28
VRTIDDADVKGSATVGGDDVQVGVNRPPSDGTSVAVQASQRTQRANLHNVSSVRTLEGSEAYVAVGASAPVARTNVVHGYHGPVVYQSTEYVDARTGFGRRV